MKTNILIKDLIYFGACAEGYNMDTCKLVWGWKYACGCDGDLTNPLHSYELCAHQDNLFWSHRFTDLGRTIKMGMQQDEITEVTCKLEVREEDASKLRTISVEAEDLLEDFGMEYYDLFVSKIDAEKACDRLSVMEEHSFYTRTKDWYLANNVTPIMFEEIKVNVVCKYIAQRLLNQLIHNKEAVVEAKWTPNIGDDEELLFSEHVVKLEDGGHVTSDDTGIKAASS
jgi:hypothetical protein